MRRSKFSLSHTRLLSCDMGNLIPIALTEVLPGDSIQMSTSLLVRVSPLIAPVMHPVRVRIHHWFVPHRLVWDGWEDFITGGPDNDDAQIHPRFNDTSGPKSLDDYYGLPPSVSGTYHSALPARGYALIYNEWYRDADLNQEVPYSTDAGTDTTTGRVLRSVCWEKDYFTSARPWPQKGPDVTLPLGASAPIISSGQQPQFSAIDGSPASSYGLVYGLVGSEGAAQLAGFGVPGGTDEALKWGQQTGLIADLANATPPTINKIREAFALQRYAEARARYGSRYTEYLRYLGVKSSDARLQRPEYLGGGKQVIQFSEVLQTAPDTDSVVGELKGHGIGAVRSNRFRRFFEEHGHIHTLLSVLPKTMYMQGIPFSWLRTTKEDYWQKELEHIGQREIINREIYAAGPSPTATFGWQDRYDEYRRAESGVAGEFRNTLNYWHYCREFAAPPVLNGSFVQADPTKRVNAVQTNDVLWIMANHSIQARRLVAQTGRSFIF